MTSPTTDDVPEAAGLGNLDADPVQWTLDQLAAARARIAELEAELERVKGHRAELAERCYRKDLELDELRTRGSTDR